MAWALLGVVLFSFSVPLTKVAVEGFDPFLTATGRAAIAGALAVVLLAWRRVPRPPRDQLRPLFLTMLGAVFGWPILLALALQRTTSAHAAVIAAFMPLTTALIAVLALGLLLLLPATARAGMTRPRPNEVPRAETATCTSKTGQCANA